MKDTFDYSREYGMAPADVVFTNCVFGKPAAWGIRMDGAERNMFIPVGSVVTASSRPVGSCEGCGASAFKRGQCTYCGRHA